MHIRSMLRTCPQRSHHRRRPIAVSAAIAVAAVIVATGGLAAPTATAAIPVPEGIIGNPHSPTVAKLAAVAVDAKAVHERTGSVADERHFEAALADAAAATAFEFGVSPIAVEQAWGSADDEHQIAFLSALTQLGVEYRSNTSEPFVGFDCSGLTTFAWGSAGVPLSRQSGSQISEAQERTPETAMAGDLVQYPGHVMMYLGVPGAVVHSSNHESDVELWMLGDRSVRYGDPTES